MLYWEKFEISDGPIFKKKKRFKRKLDEIDEELTDDSDTK
jgi:hypothetical protein